MKQVQAVHNEALRIAVSGKISRREKGGLERRNKN
jgi:hypothetical protein